jgi:DNA polymerase III delta prime subunit
MTLMEAKRIAKKYGFTVLQEGLDRDIQKMKDYMAKGSNPNQLAASIKDLEKLKNRWAIAKAIGWKDAEIAFKEHAWNRIDDYKDYDVFEAEMKEIAASLGDKELPRLNYNSEGRNAGKLFWLSGLAGLLANNGISFETKDRRPESREMEKDRSNGCAWTVAKTFIFEKDGEKLEIRSADTTNEGGGTYGYSIDGHGDNLMSKQAVTAKVKERLKDKFDI